MEARNNHTGETDLLDQERGRTGDGRRRRWDRHTGLMIALPRVQEARSKRLRRPRVYNRAGPKFEIFDRKTGNRLWTISGTIAHVTDQMMKQLKFVNMPISAIKFRKIGG